MNAKAARHQREFELRRDHLLNLVGQAPIPIEMFTKLTDQGMSAGEVEKLLLPAVRAELEVARRDEGQVYFDQTKYKQRAEEHQAKVARLSDDFFQWVAWMASELENDRDPFLKAAPASPTSGLGQNTR